MASTIATRITGSADLFASRWDGTLPGGLACGRRPSYGLNSAGFLGRTSLVEVMGEQAGNTSMCMGVCVLRGGVFVVGAWVCVVMHIYTCVDMYLHMVEVVMMCWPNG